MSIETAVAVWAKLVDAKLIHPKTYDRELMVELAATLGLNPKKPFADELASSTLTARDLLRAMLQALEPVTEMLKDLLDLYSAISAKTADGDSLIIEYEFDEGHPVDLLLSQFRIEVNKLIEQVRPIARIEINDNLLWSFPYRQDPWEAVADPQLDAWRRSYTEDNEYKDFPRQRPTGKPELDEAILGAEAIFSAVLRATHRYGSTREALEYREDWSSHFDFSERGILAQIHSDRWLASSVIGLDRAIKEGRIPPQSIVDELTAWTGQFPAFPETEKVLMSVVESLLALPMWGKRHALYSAWLLTQVHAAVDGKLDYVVHNNKLSFPFGGAHLATLETVEGPLELWTELRSDLHKPRGKNRTNGIQPDYRFVADRTDPVTTTPLAIEAKQYAKSTKTVHAEAIDDYTRGLPNAKVVLAAYGPVSKKVLDSIPQMQADRAVVIRHLKPGVIDAMEEFARAVTGALPRLKEPFPTYPLTITLTWNPSVHDVDLHAFTADLGTHIWWRNLSEGVASLSGHSVDGNPQVLTVADVPPTTLSVWVNVYDVDPLSIAEPLITITATDRTVTFRPPLPPPGARTWHVLDLLPDGELSKVDDYSPLPQ